MKHYDWPEQEAIFWKRARRSYWRAMIFLLFHKPEVIDCAYQRWAHGYYTFGDNLFHRSVPEIRGEKLEEGADLLNYQIVQDEKKGRR